MSKRIASESTHTSMRLLPDVAANVVTVAKLTGWSVARVVNHHVLVGIAAHAKQQEKLDALVTETLLAMKVRMMELKHARAVAAAKGEPQPELPEPAVDRDAAEVAQVNSRAAKRAAGRKAVRS